MIEIDVKDIKNMSAKLAKASRATFPVAVRSTLNDMAFDVKKNQLIPVLKNKSGMTIRNESFFRKYSGFQKAEGFKIESMYSQVGMMPSGNASKAVNRLDEQDIGGTLGDRNFVPDENVRQGKTRSGKVRKSGFIQRQKLIAKVSWGDKQKLIREVTGSKIKSGGKGKGNVIIYGSILYEIVGFKRIRKNNTIKLHLIKLYSYDKGRKIAVKPHRFMQKSATPAGNKMQEFFNANMAKQLKRQGL